jgi:glycosyltransferase involved in cell wall biosynthesis
VLIVAEFLDNIQDPQTYNSRFLTVADMLTQAGHKVRIVTTDFIHSVKQHVSGVTSYKNCELKTLHEPGYPKNVSLKRFYSHWVLSQNLKNWLKTIDRPDVIYCAVPSLDFAYEAARYSKQNGVKFVLDIQDLWPEAFEMVINVPVLTNIAFAPLRWKANSVYRSADRIVAVSRTYADRALRVHKSMENGTVVFLGTNLDRFDSYRSLPPVLEKMEDEIRLGYIGTLGHSYDLKTVMNAIELLKDKTYYKRIRLVVAGDGPLRSEFEKYSASKNISVTFTGMLPYPQMVATLCTCDIAINPIKKGSAGTIINKHGDYAAAGIPVINSQECEEYRKLVKDFDMGLNVECESPNDMAEKIALLVENNELSDRLGRGARVCAEEKFNRAHSYSKIIEAIET